MATLDDRPEVSVNLIMLDDSDQGIDILNDHRLSAAEIDEEVFDDNSEQLIKIARAEIGVREGRDSNGNWNNRVKYNAWYADKVNDNAF